MILISNFYRASFWSLILFYESNKELLNYSVIPLMFFNWSLSIPWLSLIIFWSSWSIGIFYNSFLASSRESLKLVDYAWKLSIAEFICFYSRSIFSILSKFICVSYSKLLHSFSNLFKSILISSTVDEYKRNFSD